MILLDEFLVLADVNFIRRGDPHARDRCRRLLTSQMFGLEFSNGVELRFVVVDDQGLRHVAHGFG